MLKNMPIQRGRPTKNAVSDQLLRVNLGQEAVKMALCADWERAVKLNREILELCPDNCEAANRLAKALMELARYQEAREVLKICAAGPLPMLSPAKTWSAQTTWKPIRTQHHVRRQNHLILPTRSSSRAESPALRSCADLANSDPSARRDRAMQRDVATDTDVLDPGSIAIDGSEETSDPEPAEAVVAMTPEEFDDDTTVDPDDPIPVLDVDADAAPLPVLVPVRNPDWE